jgi:metal-sulfur cluster biosynthetic enzyme
MSVTPLIVGLTAHVIETAKVWRLMSQVSDPELKARLISALVTKV